jgi:DNA-binding HxlR family transcriptional regulator
MQRKSFKGMNCSIARALDEVGEWWTLLIIRDCVQGVTRFDEFQTSLGIARNILTARLERLTALGIIERFLLEERANTDGYRLTKKGEDLYPVVVSLTQWGDRWLAKDGKPPSLFLEDATGEPIEKIRVRGKSGRSLSFRDVRYAPGPGATALTRSLIQERNQRVLGRKRGIS